LFIGLFRALGFSDENDVLTQRYYDFLDQTQSGRVLATAIREAYEDLFAINKKAHTRLGDIVQRCIDAAMDA
jgi:hypothetical protein